MCGLGGRDTSDIYILLVQPFYVSVVDNPNFILHFSLMRLSCAVAVATYLRDVQGLLFNMQVCGMLRSICPLLSVSLSQSLSLYLSPPLSWLYLGSCYLVILLLLTSRPL